jgi:hypothetical protein
MSLTTRRTVLLVQLPIPPLGPSPVRRAPSIHGASPGPMLPLWPGCGLRGRRAG